MSGISVELPPQNVLPTLAQSILLQGYQSGRPTEFLILLRRYVAQARELNAGLTDLAAARNVCLVEQRGGWYGFDAIHIRLRSDLPKR